MILDTLIRVRTGKLDANASIENGKYPFLHVLEKFPELIIIPLIVNVY